MVFGIITRPSINQIYNYSNTFIDQKNKQGKIELNTSIRAQLYQDIDNLFLEDLPLIYGIQTINSYIGLGNFKGLNRSVNPFNVGVIRFWELCKETSTNECPEFLKEIKSPEVPGFSGLLLIYSMIVMTLVMLIRTRRRNSY